MLIHKKLTRWIIQLTLIIVIGLVSLHVYEKIQYELLQKKRETSLNSAYTKSLMVVTEINNRLNKMEQIVTVLVSESAFMLDHHPFDAR